MSLVDDLACELRLNGSAQASIADDDSAGEWRSAARAAARTLGRPVETMRHGTVVAASLKDWPTNELEQQVLDARMRAAMDRISSSASFKFGSTRD